MDKKFEIHAIGEVRETGNKMAVVLDRKYLPGLVHLEGFSHILVIWWAHLTDHPQNRESLTAVNLFKKAPDNPGVFGTRSPSRPNPLMISTIKLDQIDMEKGILYTPFIDAVPGTPVLDIKPYFPMERVKQCTTPGWFSHWPQWAEDVAGFNWKDEISFE